MPEPRPVVRYPDLEEAREHLGWLAASRSAPLKALVAEQQAWGLSRDVARTLAWMRQDGRADWREELRGWRKVWRRARHVARIQARARVQMIQAEHANP